MTTPWADIFRSIVMFMGGVTIALKYPILSEHAETLNWFRRGRLRRDDVSVTLALRSLAHVLALVFIIIEIGTRLGDSITWRTPAAFIIFAVSAFALLETNRRDRVLKGAIRRDSDEPTV